MANPALHTSLPATRRVHFGGNVRLLQWLDRRVGAPGCLAFTLMRRLGGLLGVSRAPGPVHRILFLKLAEQGSTVLAYDTVRRAVERYGRENVHFLVFEENRFIVDLLGLVPVENVFTVQTRSAVTMATSTLTVLRAIRRKGIDACIDMEFFARSTAILGYLTGAHVRVGFHCYFGEGPYRGDLLTHRVLYNPHLHTSSTFSSLLQALDADPAQLPAFAAAPRASEVPALFQPTADESAAVRALLPRLGAPAGGRLILLNANASDLLPLRRWAEDNYVTLARRLLAAFGDVCVAFTGAAGEAPRIRELVQAVDSPRCLCLAGQTTLRELLVLYGLSEVLVTNDSGPAHFAALTTIDVVALFGPETPLLFAALGPRSHTLWAGLACSPCVNALNNRQTSCRNNLCMQAISVDEVFAMVAQIYRIRTGRTS